jgi:hypothetical protein
MNFEHAPRELPEHLSPEEFEDKEVVVDKTLYAILDFCDEHDKNFCKKHQIEIEDLPVVVGEIAEANSEKIRTALEEGGEAVITPNAGWVKRMIVQRPNTQLNRKHIALLYGPGRDDFNEELTQALNQLIDTETQNQWHDNPKLLS